MLRGGSVVTVKNVATVEYPLAVHLAVYFCWLRSSAQ
jgi:hypothetical protein